VLLFFGVSSKESPPPKPEPPAKPSTPDDSCPRRPRRPAGELVGAISVGGPVGPAGQQVACDLPVAQRLKNTGGMGPRGPGSGAGLCVFTSIEHAGHWQNVRPLIGLQQKMTHEPGGGYPEKVDQLVAKYAKGVTVIQYEGKDPGVLESPLKTGRMPCVTFNGHDKHYGNQTIAYMGPGGQSLQAFGGIPLGP
jgi:hypothetical protein